MSECTYSAVAMVVARILDPTCLERSRTFLGLFENPPDTEKKSGVLLTSHPFSSSWTKVTIFCFQIGLLFECRPSAVAGLGLQVRCLMQVQIQQTVWLPVQNYSIKTGPASPFNAN